MSIASSIKSEAKAAMRRAGLLTGGLFAMVVGLVFLTGALWLYLTTLANPLTAALVIGSGYFGVGLIALAVSSRSTSVEPEPAPMVQPAQQPDQPPLVQAFLYGMSAGSSATKSQH